MGAKSEPDQQHRSEARAWVLGTRATKLEDEWWKGLSAYARGREGKDVLPTAVENEFLAPVNRGREIREGWRLGELLRAQSRLLATDVGGRGSEMFAVPTTRGHLCVSVTKVDQVAPQPSPGSIWMNPARRSAAATRPSSSAAIFPR
jgi:hypothetical protein